MNHLHTISTGFFLFISSITYAQTATKIIQAECGKVIEGEFTAKYEAQDIKIRMGAGDMLEMNIVPIGKYLKIRADIFDPSGSAIFKEDQGMFRTEKKSLVLKTEVLSATGIYTVRIYDAFFSQETNIGAYTVYPTCYKKNGQIIEPK